ncbi:SDR family NAD(P)-dependent oxidoreductase [Mycobacterium sp. CBMA271]|uniref:SDR family NAD(P)-dependent oxidoreductase n=1 Tax=unclassified Mycobacteroides TaxID=2618759 RepID=UPI0012DC39E9|nr:MULTISPECIES: SDR family NAD(P)-dependent oxidoreductase [unclassified Mycobacteroides]MUM19902.1 oxidoreductase [Mycobacteroides sp. CBMA 326]MUM20940.1 SDR family NAD(P)-dependent oxidoreductase [Mycobacteroides sp. CBMA 271]
MNPAPDLTGQTVVITGANGGLGAQIAALAASRNARVILACRNIVTAQAVAGKIGGNTVVERLDLSDLASVRAFAERVDEPIDVLINNAGIMNVPYGVTADGFESTFGTNHLGHFVLTGLLLERIRARVVTVSSVAHLGATRSSLADPLFRNHLYRRAIAYANSKAANLMFARELNRRLVSSGSPVISIAAHPGVVSTGLYDHSSLALLQRLKPLVTALGGTLAEGMAPIVHAGFGDGVRGGEFYGPRFGYRGRKVVHSVSSRLSRNHEQAQRLWTFSEELSGIRYPLSALTKSNQS